MKIKSNYQSRPLLYWEDLTDKEKGEFNHELKERMDYFKYKGNIYCMGDFVTTQCSPFPEYWHGYSSDSFFSGVLIKITPDYSGVIVGTYIE